MVFPDKYTDLNYSILNIGSLILKSLVSCHVRKYDEVEDYVASILGQKAKTMFIYALGLLYILGKVSYSKDTDIIELTNHEVK